MTELSRGDKVNSQRRPFAASELGGSIADGGEQGCESSRMRQVENLVGKSTDKISTGEARAIGMAERT